MAVNTGVDITKAVGYAVVGVPIAGVVISKAVGYAVLGDPAGPCAKSQRGNIDYDQIRLTVRQGDGSMFQMFGGGPAPFGHVAVFDGCGNIVDGGSPSTGAGGTVTSVGLTVPSRQTVAGSPITTSGTLAITDNIQAANQVFAGPASGTAVAPTFRALASADLPLATTSLFGAVKPDGTTITISGGVISSTGGGTGGGGGTTPVIRGSGIQASSASSYTVAWPTGTVAGDMAVIMVGHGYAVTTPSGWTQLDNEAGTQWNGAAFYRVLSAADITAGNVTVSVAGVYDGVVSIATFKGATGTPRMVAAQRNGSGSTSITLTTDGSPVTTDTMLYFGSNRAASTDTVSLGSNLQQANDAANASGCLYAGSPAASGALSPVFSYSVAGTGNYQIVVDVPAVGSGTVTSVALSAPAEFTVSGSPVTSSGTLTFTKATQSANLIYAGPATGAAAAPAFRAVVAADFPSTVVNGFQTPWLSNINGANFQLTNANAIGIGTTTPANVLTACDSSRPITAGGGGRGALCLSSGTGATTDDNLLFGVHTGDYSWIQAAKAGTAYRNLILNGLGGNIGIGNAAPAYPLDVTGTINASGDIYASVNLTVNAYNDGTNWRVRSAGSAAIFQMAPSGVLIFGSPTAAAGAVMAYRQVAVFSDQNFNIYPGTAYGSSFNVWTSGSLSGTNALPTANWTTTIVNPVSSAYSNGLIVANANNSTSSALLSIGSVSTAYGGYQQFLLIDGLGGLTHSPAAGSTCVLGAPTQVNGIFTSVGNTTLNAYNSAGWKYVVAGPAWLLTRSSAANSLQMYTAAAGSAGAALGWSSAFLFLDAPTIQINQASSMVMAAVSDSRLTSMPNNYVMMANNGNTGITFYLRGTDGTLRSGTLTVS